MTPEMFAIVERVFDLRPDEVYGRLERDLRLGGRETQLDRSVLERALEASQDNAREAHRLYAYARVEYEAFEIDGKIAASEMREQATAALEAARTAKKEEGSRAKQITEADVEAWIVGRYPDEHRRLQVERKRLEKTIEHLERLAELWKSRSRTLEALYAAARV